MKDNRSMREDGYMSFVANSVVTQYFETKLNMANITANKAISA